MSQSISHQRKAYNPNPLEGPSIIRRLLKDIKEAINGTEQDFTEGHLGRGIFLLSIPMVLEMMMEAIFAVVDIFFVSKLGADAVATVGLTESIMTLVYAIGIGFSMATTAMVSRRIGEKNPGGAAIAATQSVAVGIILSLVMGIPGLFYARELLELMGASPTMIDDGYLYTAIMMTGNIVIMLLFIINAVFRSAGDAAISMKILWMANIANIILDPILIFGLGPVPELGIKGAAIATVTGRGLAVIYQFYLLGKGTRRIKINRDHVRIDLPVVKRLIRLSYGGIGQYLISTASWIGLMRIMAMFGSEVLAGYTIAIRIIIFSLLPSWGLANAAATLVGQNLGAKKPKRAERSVWITSFINMGILFIAGIVFISAPGYFIRLFIDDPDVIEHGITALRIISLGYLCYGIGMVMPQAFNGAGDTATPTWINFISFWLLEIPLAYLFAITWQMEERGVFYAIVVAETMLAVLGTSLFVYGKWKLKVL